MKRRSFIKVAVAATGFGEFLGEMLYRLLGSTGERVPAMRLSGIS